MLIKLNDTGRELLKEVAELYCWQPTDEHRALLMKSLVRTIETTAFSPDNPPHFVLGSDVLLHMFPSSDETLSLRFDLHPDHYEVVK